MWKIKEKLNVVAAIRVLLWEKPSTLAVNIIKYHWAVPLTLQLWYDDSGHPSFSLCKSWERNGRRCYVTAGTQHPPLCPLLSLSPLQCHASLIPFIPVPGGSVTQLPLAVCVCIYIYLCVCVCVCGSSITPIKIPSRSERVKRKHNCSFMSLAAVQSEGEETHSFTVSLDPSIIHHCQSIKM